MMPRTKNKLAAAICISGLQKHIRRGEEELAMQAAAELLLSGNKSLIGWLLNRLVIIAHEDIGIANPTAVMFVQSTVPHVRELTKDPDKLDKAGMLVGNCILIMCRGPKSRLGDHFQCAAAKPVKFGTPYEPPEYVFDKHTRQGRKMGRDLDHFFESSAQLDNDAELDDPYRQRAEGIWRAMDAGTMQPVTETDSRPGLFDDDDE